MAKKGSKRRRVRREQRQTNWLLIGGVVAIGVIGLFALLFVALRAPATTQETTSLETYCQDNPDNCVTRGAEDAPVTMIEVSDFGCPHCRNYIVDTEPLIEQRYVESGQVRYVVLPYSLRPETRQAANAGLCAAEQGRFFEYSKAMFAQFDDPDSLSAEGITRAGEVAGLDLDSLTACMSQGRYTDVLQDNIAAASNAGVSSTPQFFINGRQVEGNQPFANFQQLIEAFLTS